MKEFDLLKNRALFYSNKKKGLADPTQPEHANTKDTSQTGSKSNSDTNGAQRDSQQPSLTQKAPKTHSGVAGTFFYWQEFVIGWIRELSFQSTSVTTILSITIFWVALVSTLQKREGDRWWRCALQAKLPGYSTLYQPTSWESLRNCVFDKPINPYSPFSKDENLFHNRTNNSAQELTKSTQSSDMIQFVDLYKDKAFIYVRVPWAKTTRKDFVGFFPDRGFVELPGSDNVNPGLKDLTDRFERKKFAVLPWYRIEALNRPSRVVLARSKKQDKIQSQNRLNKNNLRLQREKSLINLRDIQRGSKPADDDVCAKGSRPEWDRNDNKIEDLFSDKIAAFEYIFSSQPSRERVYVESDVIPLKLQSPYSARVTTQTSWKRNRASIASFQAQSKTKMLGLYRKERLELKKQREDLFVKSTKQFRGKHLYYLEEGLRELFYLYGFSPPNNLARIADKRLAQLGAKISSAQGKKSNLKKEISVDVENWDYPETEGNQSGDNSTNRNGTQLSQFLPQRSAPKSFEEQSSALQRQDHTLEPTAQSKSFPFKNWPLLANAGSYALQDSQPFNNFERNNWIVPRLVSGYKWPDCTQKETSSLFKNFVIRRFLISCSVSFSHSHLVDQLLLRPLYVKLPPAVPFAFFNNLALSLARLSPSVLRVPAERNAHTRVPSFASVQPMDTVGKVELERLDAGNIDSLCQKRKIPKYNDIEIEYKLTSLQELKHIQNVFAKLGKDYQSYLNLPKDSPLAIRVTPSLEDDKILEFEETSREKREDQPDTEWEILQKLREQEQRFEEGKEFRPFAYQDRFAYRRGNPGSVPSLQDHDLKNNSSVNSEGFMPTLAEEENFWIRSRLGADNMLSDRKYSFFGRKHLLTKRLVAQEEKEINDQLFKESYCTPEQRESSEPKQADLEERVLADQRSVPENDVRSQSDTIELLSNRSSMIGKPARTIVDSQSRDNLDRDPDSAQGFALTVPKYTSLHKLHKKARKRLIQLLGPPTFVARDGVGARNRTRKADRSVRGKVLDTPFERLRWQKKRFRSHMLSTPSQRHLVLPEISIDDWKKILEWQLKNYFFLEDKRIEELQKQNPNESYKLKRVQIYLPWVTIRTPLNKPFQWPLTRLDYTDQISSTQIGDGFCKLPSYKPVEYWDYGGLVSLSQFNSDIPSRDLRIGPSRVYRENEPFLFEAPHNQSWLLVYRLFLAFALQNLCKYIYRVGVKTFLIQIINSDLGLMTTSPQFREWIESGPAKPFYTPDKRLRDVASIEDNIPTLSEIVWYLRNRGRGRAKCRGLLLVGPSGAEKTSVVQALAGECRRPVIVQSMNALLLTNGDPYEQLEKMFALARKKAPCILFLDDLDVIGRSRGNVVTNDLGAEDLLFSLAGHTTEGRLGLASLSQSLHTTLLPQVGETASARYLNWELNPLSSNPIDQPDLELMDQEGEKRPGSVQARGGPALALHQDNEEFQRRRLNLMLRLLTELDGAMPFNGVVVVATSERPALLDPALLRAGRFDRRIHLSLPSKERRIQLFKRETQKIGHMLFMPWDYLGTRTTNMSVADITSAINHSAIRAILDNTVHTVETLEHGLNCVAGLPNKPFVIAKSHRHDPFHSSRLAFYQAGRAVVHSFLLEHPELGFCSLSDDTVSSFSSSRELSRESFQVCEQDSDTTFSARTRTQFETRLVGLYAGKAAELLHLSCFGGENSTRLEASGEYPSAKRWRSSSWLWQSNLGFSELLKASSLIHLMIDRWYLYSEKVFTYKINRVVHSLNHEQMRNETLFPLARRFSKELEWDAIKPNFWDITGYTNPSGMPVESGEQDSKQDEHNFNKQIFQERGKVDWWQAKICKALEKTDRPYGKWYRIYLPKANEDKWNEEWVPPDCVFHQSLTLSNLALQPSRMDTKEPVQEREDVKQDKIPQQKAKSTRRLRFAQLNLKGAPYAEERTPHLKTLNDLYLFERDRAYQNAVINSFYTAFNLLNQNRELLDIFADHLIRYQILRSHEIAKICSLFLSPSQ